MRIILDLIGIKFCFEFFFARGALTGVGMGKHGSVSQDIATGISLFLTIGVESFCSHHGKGFSATCGSVHEDRAVDTLEC